MVATARDQWVSDTFGIDPSHAGNAGSAAPADPAALGKARQLWVATRARIAGDVGKLCAKFDEAFAGHDDAAAMSQEFRTHMDSVLHELDEELAHALDALAKAPPPDRASAAKQAQDLIDRYAAHAAGDPVVAAIDDNPVVPMNLRGTIEAALSAISRQVAA